MTSKPVENALGLELAGDNAGRESALRERLSEQPDDAAAHWHLGEVRVGEAWVSFDRVADYENRWSDLHRYRELRAAQGRTADDHLALAAMARKHRLFDEERAHLAQVVSLAPFHEEANQRLGNVLIDSRWISRESMLRAMNAQVRWSRSLEQHGEAAKRLVRSLRKLPAPQLSKMDDPFADWCDPERIFALEQAVGDTGDAVHNRYLEWLGTCDCYEATVAIVRQALFSERSEIRVAATESLKDRNPEDYLQQLVASVREVRVSEGSHPSLNATGRPAIAPSHAATMQWEDMDTVWTAHLSLRQPIQVIDFLPARPRTRVYLQNTFNRVVLPQDLEVEQRLNTAVELWRLNAELLASTTEVRHQRTFRTLSTVFDRPVMKPQDAWNLWKDVADTELMQERLSVNYEEGWYRDRFRRVRRGPATPVAYSRVREGSCLAAGTPIVTETGPQAVETIEPGDRVLSQDPETGELAFNPVLGLTRRENAKLLRLKTAENEITCSQGHPFWVNGIGWIQARGLRPGMPLHGVQGSTELVSVEPTGEGTVHNIVVADAHTYFIGRTNAFLSHDVTHRQPTNTLVPGLQPTWHDAESAEPGTPVTKK